MTTAKEFMEVMGMSKCNSLFMEMDEREFQNAYAEYLEQAEKDGERPMDETEFAEYLDDKKQAREDSGQFGAGA